GFEARGIAVPGLQTARDDAFTHQVVQPGFVDRGHALLQQSDPLRVDVNRRYMMAQRCEARRRYQPHVTAPDDRDLRHESSRLFRQLFGWMRCGRSGGECGGSTLTRS